MVVGIINIVYCGYLHKKISWFAGDKILKNSCHFSKILFFLVTFQFFFAFLVKKFKKM